MKHSSASIALALFSLFGCTSGVRNDPNEIRDYPIRPVPFTQVRVNDDFWAPKIRINHEVTIPIAFRKSEETGRIENFLIAGGLKEGHFCSLYPFDDSDVYKNIEAAAYSLQIFPDPELESYLDTLISYIAQAQEEDGYLYTNRTINPDSTHEMAGQERWINEEQHSHELYNAGHLYEAAVAHYQATGKRTLLDVAIRNANLVDSVFGWGKLEKTPGHQEIELGLVKLYRLTGEKKYLDLARFFLDRRGPGGDPYNQMHLKVTAQQEAVGHAVRAQYMYAAMADIAALTGDSSYLHAIDRLWEDVTTGKTYLTGGIGAEGGHEGFGRPFDLPNATAYCETCAAIANALWNYRMFLLHGQSRYFDVLEKVIYNGLISGVSLRGDSFFYPNPLESSGNYARKPWFGCACCPVNITRFLPSLPGYIYATKANAVYINLYMTNSASLRVGDNILEILQETGYPWDGNVRIRVNPEERQDLTLLLRIPGWARGEAFPTSLYTFQDKPAAGIGLFLNGREFPLELRDGYAVISRSWSKGDEITLILPMEVMEVIADPKVKADSGMVAIQRGPLIYCAEQADHGEKPVSEMNFREGIRLEYNPAAQEPGGIRPIEGNAGTVQVRLIPYYSWANRGKGAMKVWFPR
jgi:hypothetical protein